MNKRCYPLLLILLLGTLACQEETLTREPLPTAIADDLTTTGSITGVGIPISWCTLVRSTYIGPPLVPAPDQITTYTTTVDGDVRSFDVYVPPGYPNNGPYPLVFMFHGTGQTATKIGQSTQWHQLSRSGEDFIVVYPQAESYDMIQRNGTIQYESKWVTAGMLPQMVDSTQAKDDVAFFRSMLNGIVARLDVDCSKIYACGFSNGGAFVKTELRYHFGDQLAATVSTGGIGSPVEYNPTKGHNSPHLETCGSRDEIKLTVLGYPAGATLPLDPIDILNSPLRSELDNFARDCGFAPISILSSSHLSNRIPTPIGPVVSIPLGVRFHYSSNTDPAGDPYWTEIEYYDTQTRYRFRMVDDLTHAVPTPSATPPYNREDYIPIYWDFMNTYSLN